MSTSLILPSQQLLEDGSRAHLRATSREEFGAHRPADGC